MLECLGPRSQGNCCNQHEYCGANFRSCVTCAIQPLVMRILTASLWAGLVMLTLFPARAASLVIISEFMAQNTRSLSDQDGDRSDWIEIYNGNTNAIDLFGWYLTDTTNNYRKWQFPP